MPKTASDRNLFPKHPVAVGSLNLSSHSLVFRWSTFMIYWHITFEQRGWFGPTFFYNADKREWRQREKFKLGFEIYPIAFRRIISDVLLHWRCRLCQTTSAFLLFFDGLQIMPGVYTELCEGLISVSSLHQLFCKYKWIFVVLITFVVWYYICFTCTYVCENVWQI